MAVVSSAPHRRGPHTHSQPASQPATSAASASGLQAAKFQLPRTDDGAGKDLRHRGRKRPGGLVPAGKAVQVNSPGVCVRVRAPKGSDAASSLSKHDPPVWDGPPSRAGDRTDIAHNERDGDLGQARLRPRSLPRSQGRRQGRGACVSAPPAADGTWTARPSARVRRSRGPGTGFG